MNWKWWHTHDWTKWEDAGIILIHERTVGSYQMRECKTCGKKERNDIW